MRAMLAPLSPHEEITLRRIALGFGARERLSPRYVERLEQLQLIEETDGLLRPTEAGRQRYATLERPTKWADDESGAAEISRLLTAEPVKTNES